MMAPSSVPTRLHVPPLAYAGGREWLAWERADLMGRLAALPRNSRLRPGIEFVIKRITARQLAIGEAEPPPPGSNRGDLQ